MAWPRIFSSYRKVALWLLAFALLIFAPFYVNSVRYFADSGVKGYYLAAVHAFDVLELPETPPVKVPKGLRALTHEELAQLSGGRALNYIHPTRREYEQIVRFVSPNEYRSSSSLGLAPHTTYGHYLLDGNRVCNLPGGLVSFQCYRIYTDDQGGLFGYIPAFQEFPAEWQRIEYYGERGG
jgi:hypothetical protein